MTKTVCISKTDRVFSEFKPITEGRKKKDRKEITWEKIRVLSRIGSLTFLVLGQEEKETG